MTETKVIHEIFTTFKLKRSPKGSSKGFGSFGDDAVSVPAPSAQDQLVLSTDSFTDGTHFDDNTPLNSVGYKSLVASISDITAMGAQPSFFMLNLILPSEFKGLKSMIDGLYKASLEYNLSLIGGDVACGKSLSISITAGGYQPKSQMLENYGAKLGESIFVSASPGQALLGFEEHKNAIESEYVDQFLYPKTPVNLGLWLSKKVGVTTLRDVSDGVISEIREFSEAHNFSIKLSKPLHSNEFIKACEKLNLNPDEIYFKGGEEYSLMWTLKNDEVDKFIKDYEKEFKTPPIKIGEVSDIRTDKPSIYFEPNQSLIDSIIPFEHFSS